jgi:hypothetical protein
VAVVLPLTLYQRQRLEIGTEKGEGAMPALEVQFYDLPGETEENHHILQGCLLYLTVIFPFT